MAVLPLILYSRIKRGGLHEIHCGRIKGWEKAKWGNLWDWKKSKLDVGGEMSGSWIVLCT